MDTERRLQIDWTGYLVGLASVALAVLLRRLVLQTTLANQSQLLLILMAVMLAAWYGGLGPGLFATALGGLAAPLFLSLDLSHPSGRYVLMVFLVEGGIISLLCAHLHLARRRAEEGQKQLIREKATSAAVERRYQLLADNVTDYAIIFTDPQGMTTSWSLGATGILGWREPEMLGQNVSRIFTPEDVRAGVPQAEIQQAIKDGRSADERWHMRQDGSRFYASGVTTALYDDNGRLAGLAKILRDLTQQKRDEEERSRLLERERRARTEAETANRAKDEFLATVSHELRTPLNAILGWSVMLGRGKTSPQELAEGLEIIERNAKAQAQLIEDLLDVSRIISGKIRLTVKPTDMATVVEQGIDAVKLAAEAKEITILREIDPNAGPVYGDAARLQQIIWNLLSNAVKFTARGGRVKIGLSRVSSRVQVVVQDNGIGIPREFLPYVFDRFRQADPTTTRARGGLGLGMAITRHLAELHGGEITADSEGEGKGATFTLTLPLRAVRTEETSKPSVAPVTSGAPAPAVREECAEELDGARVLVVDDEADARMLVSRVLTDCRSEVRAVDSVAEAFEVMQEWVPDVIISDIGMPEEDGYALIRRIRSVESRRGGHVAALALTAYASLDDRRRALSAGFEVHLAKPVTPSQLISTVARLVRSSDRSHAT